MIPRITRSPATLSSIEANAPNSAGVFGLYREGSPRWMFFGEGASVRQELLKHLHSAHYDKANRQVQVQLTVLSAAQRASQLRLRLGK